MTYWIKFVVLLIAVLQLFGCGPGATGIVFDDYKKSLSNKDDEATIIVYRDYDAGGLGLPIYLNFEEAGILLPRGYLPLTVNASKEHVLSPEEGSGKPEAVRTFVSLEPNTVQYLKYDLTTPLCAGLICFGDLKAELVKVDENVAIKELKMSRNSIE